jgi:peptidoglycan biosynthesis protein MviN/MurJ (putative lipid II flippase)
MTFALPMIFLVFFIGGPLIFRALTGDAPTKRRMNRLVVLTAVFALVGLLIRFVMPDQWGQNLWVTAGGVLLIWFAWVGVLAYVALALRRQDPSARMYRWTAIIGAIGTTVPWFGLASASLMQG